MSSNEEEKQQVIAYRLEKAKKTLEDAKKVIELELWATAANRLYYAAYYAVSSLLLFHGLIQVILNGEKKRTDLRSQKVILN